MLHGVHVTPTYRHREVHRVVPQQFIRSHILSLRTGGPAVVYCALIKDLTRLESDLQRRGLRALVYHGALSAHERRTVAGKYVFVVGFLIGQEWLRATVCFWERPWATGLIGLVARTLGWWPRAAAGLQVRSLPG